MSRDEAAASSGIEFSTASEDQVWDRFVQNHPEPHPEQLSLWGTLRGGEGWSPVRLFVRREGMILGGAQILEHRLGRMGRVGYAARGPLISPRGGSAELVATALKETAYLRGLTYLVLSLPYFGHALVDSLLKVGFAQRPERLPPASGVMATLVLDLSRDIDILFGEVRKSRRNEIRRGKRAGTTVRMGTREDIPLFVDLVARHCTRLGVRSNMPGGGFAQSLWDHLQSRGQVHLFVAEAQHQAVGALMILTVGPWARAWRMGWTGAHGEGFPTQVLLWESICWAQERGFRYYDMVGFDLDDAKSVLAGRAPEAPFKCPISFFKSGWGGKVMLLPGDYCYFPNPLLRLAFRVAGRELLNSALVAWLADKVHSRTFRRG
jgi:lipid II:glycine glycyltransferase (peptidoglycan interpeptide bridge formation enzyme)